MSSTVDRRVMQGLDALPTVLEPNPKAFWQLLHRAACETYDETSSYRPAGWNGADEGLRHIRARRRSEMHRLIAYCEQRMHTAETVGEPHGRKR